MPFTPIVTPDRPVQQYRLRCRFVTDPRPTETEFTAEVVKVEAVFARDMKQRGYEYTGRIVQYAGPFPPTPRFAPPKRVRVPRGVQEPGAAERQYTTSLDPLAAADRWEWELVALFTRRAFWTEYLVSEN